MEIIGKAIANVCSRYVLKVECCASFESALSIGVRGVIT